MLNLTLIFILKHKLPPLSLPHALPNPSLYFQSVTVRDAVGVQEDLRCSDQLTNFFFAKCFQCVRKVRWFMYSVLLLECVLLGGAVDACAHATQSCGHFCQLPCTFSREPGNLVCGVTTLHRSQSSKDLWTPYVVL